MSKQIAFALLLFTLPISFAQAEEKTLGDRFLFPEQGHIEFLYCFNCEVTQTLETEQDVLKLYQQIAEIPFDEELITSFKLLEKLGLEKIERGRQPLPPGAKGPTFSFPDWRETTTDFVRDRFIQREVVVGRDFIYAETPVSQVSLNRSLRFAQANHSGDRNGVQYYKRDVQELLSRTIKYENLLYHSELSGDFEICTTTSGQTTEKFLVHPERDLIAARISEHQGKVYRATLHFYHRQLEDSEGIWVPQLSCTIHRKQEGKCKMLFSIIREAKFGEPIAEDALKVPIRQGEIYKWGDYNAKYAAKVPRDIDDIADKTPSTVRQLIETGQRNP
ncbi:hypothetical protein C5Y97_11670 [Blastopirellula marina]|uniref:Uncharacterized protein n=2 Tax=Blastopirellula marina TaxID=124 RepID=A0A2S8FWU6_9BACT|nr:hypothetical protein C5Y98_11660 [Blastopirellula marina]PTL44475.1 hypothetical protein C5Y97_11670 [Blastopirellula marina]